MPEKLNIDEFIGKKFNKFTILKELPKRLTKRRVLCRCECGKEVELGLQKVKRGDTKACKTCAYKELGIQKIKHGLSIRSKPEVSEYKTWKHIKGRCYNKNDAAYHYYGGRGIIMCDRWLDEDLGVMNFLEDMGPKPSPQHSIERNDVNGNYEPSNCRWATDLEQARNTRRNLRLEYKGEIKTLPEWCEILNLSYKPMQSRITVQKWSVEKAFETPIRKIKRKEYFHEVVINIMADVIQQAHLELT